MLNVYISSNLRCVHIYRNWQQVKMTSWLTTRKYLFTDEAELFLKLVTVILQLCPKFDLRIIITEFIHDESTFRAGFAHPFRARTSWFFLWGSSCPVFSFLFYVFYIVVCLLVFSVFDLSLSVYFWLVGLNVAFLSFASLLREYNEVKYD